jgi:hypothetical protein
LANNNQIDDEGCAGLELKKLIVLDLASNSLSKIPDLTLSTSIQQLILKNNQVNGSMEGLKVLQRTLYLLDLSYNSLSWDELELKENIG